MSAPPSRFIALVAGFVGLLLCGLAPLLPVTQTTATIQWPQMADADGAVTTITGIKGEIDAMVRSRLERLLSNMDLVTADEFGDPQTKRIWTKVNGELRQDGNTSDMVFGIAQIVSYISEFMSLNPGDVVTTGTWTDAWPVAPGERWAARFSSPLPGLVVNFTG